MRNKLAVRRPSRDEVRQGLLRLLAHARYEVLPTATTEQKILDAVAVDRTITVTASPSKGLEATFDLAERLAGHGYTVVPHVAARMVSGRTELSEICERLTAQGITHVFVPGGDAEAVGDYPDALALLTDLKELGNPFSHVGITGYPESHPTIHDDLTVQSMWDKRHHATTIVSNLTFDPSAIASWVGRLRARGVTMPLLLGMPGPVERAKLLSMATKIGVGESTKFLAKNKGLFARLAAPGGFTGERFLTQCAPALVPAEALVEGLHVFTFNQIAETEAWRSELVARLEA
ncbi:5,10-methylenetetrahydrofolate reductase [Nocardioides mangrovicus]|uniref:Methylenetetrahydrofolate reductase n=1 Tax=Nocardioides mangrovicus TaxID=2478913 RepID=A0A3L8NXC8_9ACTN|nr:methylenetetrahydrofolate reductase [Nocardioides mangrovicus]RLV47810.1 5,10-methylenetetrahydrofolate reductase [Nocardioides mangrovicus]